MADNIKGITIKFDGDTTQLDKALKKVKSEAKGVDSELSDVNRLLKFNPKNTELLGQKMTLLKQKIDATGKEITELKNIQKQMDAQGVDKNSEAYRKVQREIIEAESKLKHFKGELDKTAAKASRIGQLGDKFKQVGGKLTAAGNAMRGFSMASAAVVAGIGAITYKAAANADEINTLSKQYSMSTKSLQMYSAASELVDVDVKALTKAQVRMKKNMLSASKGTGSAAEAYKKLGVSVTDSNGHLRNNEDVFNETIAALGKMTNETERDALALQLFGRSAAELNPLIEDGGETYAKFTQLLQDNNLDFLDQEELDKANKFKDTIDTIKAVFMTMVNTIGSRLAAFLLPVAEKVQNAFAKIAGKLSQVSPGFMTFIGVLASIGAAIAPVLLIFGHLSTAIGSSFTQLSLLLQKLPILSRVFTMLTGPIGIIVGALALLFATNEKFRTAVLGLVQAIGTALLPIVRVIGATIKQLMPVIISLVNEIGNALTPIITALTPIITMLSKYITALIKKLTAIAIPVIKVVVKVLKTVIPVLSKIITGVLNFAAKVGSAFNKVKNAIVHPIETAKRLVKAAIDKIKGFFNFKVGTPNIPLPHFKISPKGWKLKDLMKGKIPHLSIDWHAQGGIFTRPTLLSAPDGTIHGVGERGAEAILPLKELWKHIDGMNGITVNVYGSDNMSVTELAAAVEQRLIQMQKRRTQAWA